MEIGARYSPFRNFEIELQGGLSLLEADYDVIETDVRIILDTVTTVAFFVPGEVHANQSTYRIKFLGYSGALNFYYKIFSRPLLDIRLFGGAGVSYANEISGTESSTFGVNGEGTDTYDGWNEWYWGYEAFSNYNHYYYHSGYGGDPNLTAGPGTLFYDYFNSPGADIRLIYEPERNHRLYFTANAGIEVEFNKFLLGASTEFTILRCDPHLLKNFYNINLSVGYVLFSKSALNKSVKTSEL